MSVLGSTMGMLPGLDSVYSTYETEFRWGGPPNRALITGGTIAAATIDAGASPTYRLRRGLVLGKITASAKWTQYSATATDGSQVAQGVLMVDLRMSDILSGSTADKQAWIMVGGPVLAGKLNGLDQKARSDMFGRFVFDDDYFGNRSGWRDVIAKTANYTVTATDNGAIFTNQGASALVVFTLPTIAKGLRYLFYCEDNDGIRVSAATANTLVTHNDATADSATFSTTGRCIGAAIEVYANADATKWLSIPHIWNDADGGTTTSKVVVA